MMSKDTGGDERILGVSRLNHRPRENVLRFSILACLMLQLKSINSFALSSQKKPLAGTYASGGGSIGQAIAGLPSKALLASTLGASLTSALQNATTTGSSGPELYQAKVQVLEDVVVKLNITKFEDQVELESLRLKMVELEGKLQNGDKLYEEQTKELQEVKQTYQTLLENQREQLEERAHKELKHRHRQQLLQLENDLKAHAKEEREALQRQLEQRMNQWKADQEREWNESLEIATAAVKAAEQRENILQIKIENAEERYQKQAAQHKKELQQLQDEWQLTAKRLERQHQSAESAKETFEAKVQQENAQHSQLVYQLRQEKNELQQQLKRATDDLQSQKLHQTTQRQKLQNDWEEQREKERKFYMETIRVLRQQIAELKAKPKSLWQRLVARVFRKDQKKKLGSFR